MRIGRRAIWVVAVGLAVTVGGMAVAAGGDEREPTVTAAAPLDGVDDEGAEADDDASPTTDAGATEDGAAADEAGSTTTAPSTTAAPPSTATTPPEGTTAPTTTARRASTTTAAPAPAPAPTTAPPTTAAPPPPPPPTTTTAPPPPPPPPPSANRSTSCESYMYQQINNARASAGKPGLAFDSGIQYIAVDWSDRLAASQVLSHNPNYASQIASVRSYRAAAENVGRGYHTNTLFQAFMNSSGHRANILGDAYTHVTVGCVTDGGGQYWVTHNFWG